MIRVVFKTKLKSDVKVGEYLNLAQRLVEETRKEEGCLMYTLHEDLNDPFVLMTLEEWENQEALEQHNQSEHVLTIVPELKKMRESQEINIYKEVQ